MNRPAIAAVAACLVAAGAAIGYVLRGGDQTAAPEPSIAATTDDAHAATPSHEHGSAASHAPAGTVVVRLTPDMSARAGVRTVRAVEGEAAAELRLPGVVRPNAYREVVVTSLVSGRVTQVQAELGEMVKGQQPLATIYSPELAEAQTAFIAARAEQQAHQQRQTRAQRLTAIGAATREELEMHEADRARVDAQVEIARARLTLLGIPEARTERLAGPQDVVTITEVRAPFSGVVTRRAANVGLNIDPSMPLFTVVDLSTVWVIADLFERDFDRVEVGSPATITTPAYPDAMLRGRVSYIDPQMQEDTRTARLRIEVPNPGGRLRLGMYVDAQVGSISARQGVLVPADAIQIVGSKSVVFVAGAAPGEFIERPVQVGGSTAGRALVVSGLEAGESVVSEGVFFVRAERERQHPGN